MSKFIAMLLSVIFVSSSPVFAASGGQVGVVDLQRVVSESKEGMAARADLLKKTEQLNGDLKVMLAEIEKSRVDFDNDSPKLSIEERSEKELTLQKKKRDFQNRQRTAKEDIKQLEADLLNKLIAKFRSVMNKIGEEEHYSVILDRNVGVFFTGKEVDITAQLIKRVDKEYATR